MLGGRDEVNCSAEKHRHFNSVGWMTLGSAAGSGPIGVSEDRMTISDHKLRGDIGSERRSFPPLAAPPPSSSNRRPCSTIDTPKKDP